MKYKRMIRYLSVKDGNVNVAYTDDFIKMMKNEYDYFFDTSDHRSPRSSGNEIRKPKNPVKSRLSGFTKVPLITAA